MSTVRVVGTIESDDEVPDFDENIEENTTVKHEKGKLRNEFSSAFSFDFGAFESVPQWKMDDSVMSQVKGKSSKGMNERIKDKIEQKRKLKDEMEGYKDILTTLQEDAPMDSKDEKKSSFFIKPPPMVVFDSFSSMNLSRPLLKAVTGLGYSKPTPIQAACIPIALKGKDICACASTGSGKTAAFMLPILERLMFKSKAEVVTRVLVLVPTRELAMQVYTVSKALAQYLPITMALATGGMEARSQEAALRSNPDIIIATPGRLVDHLLNCPTFDLQMIEILILDEADRMLDENFKDQMAQVIKMCPLGRQTMLFSATMTDEVEELTSLSLNQPVRLFVDNNTDVASTLHQEFVKVRPNREDDRPAIVSALCVRNFSSRVLVFCKTKRLAHKMRIILGLLGLSTAELHGSLPQLQRIEALESFKKQESDILVCTDLAARGLDIHGVETVISMNMPSTLKDYIHRVGRTARAGRAGRSITLVGEQERRILKEVVKSSKVPLQSRTIPASVVDKFREKIEAIQVDVKDILKQEEEERTMMQTEMEMTRAHNMVIHNDEIKSRPPKSWITEAKGRGKKDKPKERIVPKQDDEEKRWAMRVQSFGKRQARRESQTKRKLAAVEDRPSKKKQKSKKSKLSGKSLKLKS